MVYVDPTTGDLYDPGALSGYIDLLLSEIPTGTVDGTGTVNAAIPTVDLQVGQVPVGGLATDSATGTVIDVTPDDSGISPLVPNPRGKGTIVNPQWIAHKAGKAIPQAKAAATQVPHPDQTVTITGSGNAPTWEDVWTWTMNEQRDWLTFFAGSPTVTGDQVLAAADIIAASIVKALGGEISNVQLASLGIDLAISQRVDSLQATTFGAVANVNTDAQNALAAIKFITDFVVPDLQAQINDLARSIPIQIDHAIQANNIRIRDSWIAPLQNGLTAEQQQREQSDHSIIASISGIAKNVAEAAVAPALAGLAGLATRVGTLEGEAERCGRPICQMLGPQTPLGKLLKALSILADAALLAELLGMNEQQLADLLQSITTKFAALVGDFEQFFGGGGETIGGLISNAIGSAI